jgi:hypothetical protein
VHPDSATTATSSPSAGEARDVLVVRVIFVAIGTDVKNEGTATAVDTPRRDCDLVPRACRFRENPVGPRRHRRPPHHPRRRRQAPAFTTRTVGRPVRRVRRLFTGDSPATGALLTATATASPAKCVTDPVQIGGQQGHLNCSPRLRSHQQDTRVPAAQTTTAMPRCTKLLVSRPNTGPIAAGTVVHNALCATPPIGSAT